MSNASALAHMQRIAEHLTELPQLAEQVIETAHKSVQGAIPPFWPTYRAGIKIEASEDRTALTLNADAIEGAVHPKIIDWAQKVFPFAGLPSPESASDYVNAGGAYPLRIEQEGSPEYPGNRAVGAGKGVWLLATQAAREQLNNYVKELSK